MFNKLLVAIDNSEMSQYVFDKAVSVAKKSDANLMLLHVLNPLDEQYVNGMAIEPIILSPDYQDQDQDQKNEKYVDWEKLKEERLKWLRSQSEEAKKLGIVTEFNQYIGEASRTICDAARNWGAELIIIGRRGRGGLSEFFLGSVSNYVLHHAPCSVLVVQGPANIIDEEVSQTEKLKTESTI